MDLASCFMSFESGMSPSVSIFNLVPPTLCNFLYGNLAKFYLGDSPLLVEVFPKTFH